MLEFLIKQGNFPINISAGGLDIHIYEKETNSTAHYPIRIFYNGDSFGTMAFKKIDIFDMTMDLIVRSMEN